MRGISSHSAEDDEIVQPKVVLEVLSPNPLALMRVATTLNMVALVSVATIEKVESMRVKAREGGKMTPVERLVMESEIEKMMVVRCSCSV